jgi:uncharacterized membrane protein YtjA (UPF0391 family)
VWGRIGESHLSPEPSSSMELLLIVGIVLIVVALLGFGGIVSALRSAAWIILVIAIVIIVLSFLF